MYGYVDSKSMQLISMSEDNISHIDGTFIVDCVDCDFNIKAHTYIYNGESFTKHSKRPTPFHQLVDNEWVYTAPVHTSYVDARIESYPTVEEQLDMLFHAMDNSEIPKATEWYNSIKKVKDKYPKV